MAVIMDPIAVLVMMAHIMKQYVTMAKPITKKTIQSCFQQINFRRNYFKFHTPKVETPQPVLPVVLLLP